MKKLVKSALRAALYASDQVDRISDHVSGLAERGRKAIFHKEDQTPRMALCLALGIGVGIGAGILLAPASGVETRKSITFGITCRRIWRPIGALNRNVLAGR